MKKNKYNIGDLLICIVENNYANTTIKTIAYITEYQNKLYKLESITYVNDECITTRNGKPEHYLQYCITGTEISNMIKYNDYIHYPVVKE
jgi:hypothetical protein